MTKQSRPLFLRTLCILTFTGSGIAFLGYFAACLFFEKILEWIVTYSSLNSVEHLSPLFFTALMVLHCFSLVGAIRIWKLHRDGLWIYILAQLVLLFFPSVWFGMASFYYTHLLFTLVFIGGYLYHYRYLK
jgi:hypothetical protein